MRKYTYLDKKGTFKLSNPELNSYLYFPIANEGGVLSAVTPTLGGDSKMGQNSFLLSPVSSEDLHNNKNTRNFWCHIIGKGVWSATGVSASQEAQLFSDEKDETELEAGIMWQKVTRISNKFGITSEIVSYVPSTNELVEIMVVTLKNSGTSNLEIIPTAAIPIYGRSADNIRDHRHVTSLLHRIETIRTGVMVNPTLTFDERGHQINEMIYGVQGMCSDGEMPDGFYPIIEEFIGEGGSLLHPKAIYEQNTDVKDVFVREGVQLNGYEALGGIRFPKTVLAPEEEKTYIITMGYGASVEELIHASKKFFTLDRLEESLAETKEYWEDKINISYSSKEEEFDIWMHWVNFQPMLRRIYGCSFLPHHDYGKGGRGWRDLWQDCLALLIMNPDGVRNMLIDNFGGVRMDGTNATIIGKKQGEFIADRNNITRVWMDHGVWPFLTTELYINQTGDIEILLQQAPYFKDVQALRGTGKDGLWSLKDGNCVKTGKNLIYQGSILEHILLQHLTAFYDVGEHNHMLLRGADWNDALDMAKENGESVAFTAIYGGNLANLANLLRKLNDKGIHEVELAKEMILLLEDKIELYDNGKQKRVLLESYCESCKHQIIGEKVTVDTLSLSKNLLNKAEWIKEHIRQTEWIHHKEGYSWYNGYYDNSGERVEGDFESGVRMMLTSHVFTIMSGTASDAQVRDIVSSADTYLYEESMGGYRLNTDFKEIKLDLGRMFGFAYGHKENGAVFSHMAVMYANALYQRNFVKEGYKVIHSLYKHCSDFEKSRIYPGIPEYIAGNGRGLYHYLTGAASWLLLTVLTEMYGVKGCFGDLLFEPKLLAEQFDENHKASVELIFAGRKIVIDYQNNNNLDYGEYNVQSVSIDDKVYEGQNKNVIHRKDIESLEIKNSHIIRVELR